MIFVECSELLKPKPYKERNQSSKHISNIKIRHRERSPYHSSGRSRLIPTRMPSILVRYFVCVGAGSRLAS